MIEKNSKMSFWFLDCMFYIIIQREKINIWKICKNLGKHEQKFNKKNEMITRK